MTRDRYSDDLSIPDQAVLWRRIPPWHFVFNANLQHWRPSSAAFDNDPDGNPMSVILAEAALEAGRTPVVVLSSHEGYGMAAIMAGFARACGQGVARDPVPEEPAHAVVFGPKPKSVRRQLAKEAAWVLPPPS